MKLKKEHIGSEVTISEPIKITIKVIEENIDLLLKFNLNHLFENDTDTNNGIGKSSSVNTKRKGK